MDKIILYSTGCPKCKVLEKKLMQAQVSFDVCEDIDYMMERGWTQMPVLQVNDDIYYFTDAIKWVNEVKESAN